MDITDASASRSSEDHDIDTATQEDKIAMFQVMKSYDGRQPRSMQKLSETQRVVSSLKAGNDRLQEQR